MVEGSGRWEEVGGVGGSLGKQKVEWLGVLQDMVQMMRTSGFILSELGSLGRILSKGATWSDLHFNWDTPPAVWQMGPGQSRTLLF